MAHFNAIACDYKNCSSCVKQGEDISSWYVITIALHDNDADLAISSLTKIEDAFSGLIEARNNYFVCSQDHLFKLASKLLTPEPMPIADSRLPEFMSTEELSTLLPQDIR